MTIFQEFKLGLILCFGLFLIGACAPDKGPYTRELPETQVFHDDGGVYARILIPAGESVNQFVRGGENEPKAEDFLPYPGNWAEVVPKKEQSQHVLILTDALAKGSTLEIKPIAVIELDSAGITFNIVIAVPVDSLLKSIELDNFADLITDYESIRYILQTWFVNHKGFGVFELVGWHDETYAKKLL